MKVEESNRKISKALYLFMLIPLFMFGLLGGFFSLLGDGMTFATGFFGGLAAGAIIYIVCMVAMFGWEWIKKEANKGKLLPYLVVSFVVAVAISGYLAASLGNPTCIERETEPRSSCLQYADDGFEATDAQRWDKFWDSLPVAGIVLAFIAVIVHNVMGKNARKS